MNTNIGKWHRKKGYAKINKKQIAQQDFIDNTIYEMLCNILPDKYLDWNINLISDIRDAIQNNCNMT